MQAKANMKPIYGDLTHEQKATPWQLAQEEKRRAQRKAVCV
jgi:hypothetical protein